MQHTNPANLPQPQGHILNQSHYNFGEILREFNLKPYILRFWESEFDQITPLTSENGQKIYTTKDVFCIKEIKRLIFKEKLPIQKVKLIIDQLINTEETKEINVNKQLKASQEIGPEAPVFKPEQSLEIDQEKNIENKPESFITKEDNQIFEKKDSKEIQLETKNEAISQLTVKEENHNEISEKKPVKKSFQKTFEPMNSKARSIRKFKKSHYSSSETKTQLKKLKEMLNLSKSLILDIKESHNWDHTIH